MGIKEPTNGGKNPGEALLPSTGDWASPRLFKIKGSPWEVQEASHHPWVPRGKWQNPADYILIWCPETSATVSWRASLQPNETTEACTKECKVYMTFYVQSQLQKKQENA